MNRFTARSTASLFALATALGLAGTAHAAVTVTADAVFVTHHDNGSEAEGTATLGGLGNTLHTYEAVNQLKATRLYFFRCSLFHNSLRNSGHPREHPQPMILHVHGKGIHRGQTTQTQCL